MISLAHPVNDNYFDLPKQLLFSLGKSTNESQTIPETLSTEPPNNDNQTKAILVPSIIAILFVLGILILLLCIPLEKSPPTPTIASTTTSTSTKKSADTMFVPMSSDQGSDVKMNDTNSVETPPILQDTENNVQNQ